MDATAVFTSTNFKSKATGQALLAKTETTKKEEEVSRKVKSFCSETTAHGFSNIVKAEKSCSYKLTWVFIITTALSGTITHLSTVVSAYLKYKSQETTNLSNESPRFPHITICNTQPWSPNGTDAYLSNSETDVAQYINLVDSLSLQLQRHQEHTGVNLRSLMLSPASMFGNLDEASVKGIGHQLKNLILACYYLGKPCDMENDWVHILNDMYFNCFTYTGGEKKDESPTGPDSGLSLIVYLENTGAIHDAAYNVYSNIENAWGLRVTIHDQGTFPLPTVNGIDILPGYSTSISLRETKVRKLPHPWGSCTNQVRLPEYRKYKYSAQSCLYICELKYLYDKCGCLFYVTLDSVRGRDVSFCTFFDNVNSTINDYIEATACGYLYTLDFITDQTIQRRCGCDEACSYRRYDVTLSQSLWPGLAYQVDAFNRYVMQSENPQSLLAYVNMRELYETVSTSGQNREEFFIKMQDNFLRLNIYFEEMHVLERTQTESMTLTDMFANVGGTIGLWAGLSIVTVVEVLFLLLNLCILGVEKCKRIKIKPEATTRITVPEKQNEELA